MLACEPAPVKLGRGKKLRKAWPSGVMRLAGIILPGNAAPVVGSMIGLKVPLFWKLWEKLPALSSAVGVYLFCCPPVTNCPVYSCDQKKNSRFFCRLNNFGMNTGPPILYVSTLKRYGE